MSKPRGRFDILSVFDDGGYVRFTSDKTRSLSPQEIVKCLREYAGYIENGIRAKAAAADEIRVCANCGMDIKQIDGEWLDRETHATCPDTDDRASTQHWPKAPNGREP